MRVEPDGRIRDTWLPIPENWFGVREAIERASLSALQSIVEHRFLAALLPHQQKQLTSNDAVVHPTSAVEDKGDSLEQLLASISEVATKTAEQAD